MIEVAYWLFWAAIAVSVVCGVVGFFVLRTVNRGFFKAMFYMGLAAAMVFWFLWFFGRPPMTPVPPPL